MNYAVSGKSFTATVANGDFTANGYISGREGVNIKAKGDVIVTNGYVGDTESTAVSSIVAETGKALGDTITVKAFERFQLGA